MCYIYHTRLITVGRLLLSWAYLNAFPGEPELDYTLKLIKLWRNEGLRDALSSNYSAVKVPEVQ